MLPEHAMTRRHNRQAALGFRVKSGWATAVLLGGTARAPQALRRCFVELSDPTRPATRQPYHAAAGTLEENSARLRRRIEIVERVTAKSVRELLVECQQDSGQIRGAGLVVGSLTDPMTITHPHMRAHALEGQLFRTVLHDALETQGVHCSVLRERDAYAVAAAILKKSEPDLRAAVTELGRTLGGPWRAEEKLAALAAWTGLVAR